MKKSFKTAANTWFHTNLTHCRGRIIALDALYGDFQDLAEAQDEFGRFDFRPSRKNLDDLADFLEIKGGQVDRAEACNEYWTVTGFDFAADGGRDIPPLNASGSLFF